MNHLIEIEQWLSEITARHVATKPYSELFTDDGDQSVGELNDADIEFLTRAHHDMAKCIAIICAAISWTKPKVGDPTHVVRCMCSECSYTGKVTRGVLAEHPVATCPACKKQVTLIAVEPKQEPVTPEVVAQAILEGKAR